MKARVCKANDVPESTMKSFDVEGEPILVAHVGTEFYCVSDSCSHAMACLSEGELVEGCRVQCPDHAAIFDLKTGEALSLPAVSPVDTYPIVVEGDDIFVEINAG